MHGLRGGHSGADQRHSTALSSFGSREARFSVPSL